MVYTSICEAGENGCIITFTCTASKL